MTDPTAAATAIPGTESRYDVKIEKVGGARKRITVTVPVDVITEKIEESMRALDLGPVHYLDADGHPVERKTDYSSR